MSSLLRGLEGGWNSRQQGEGGKERKKKTFLPTESAPFKYSILLLLLTARKFDFFVCLGHHNKILHIGWLKQQKFISSSFGGWEDQGADKVGFILRILLLASILLGACVTFV